MAHREITCVVCGEKITDSTTNHTKLYCSELCAGEAWRRRKGKKPRQRVPSCIHNKYIECEIHKCSTCGWNPNVELKRKEALGYG